MLRFFGLAIACAMLSSCSFFESKFNLACEDIVKERLLAPSAYKRVSIERSDQPLSRDEYVAYLSNTDFPESVTKANLSDFDSGLSKPTKLRASIMYDAPNAYGTPIRSASVCEYVSESGKEGNDRDFFKIVASVDGQSQTDWLRKQLKDSN